MKKAEFKRLWHFFFHSWKESGWETEEQVTRKCSYCGKEEILIDAEYSGGSAGPIFIWEDIRKADNNATGF